MVGVMRSTARRWRSGLVLLGAAGIAVAACSPSAPARSSATAGSSATSSPTDRLAAEGAPSVTVTPADGSTNIGLDAVLQVTAINATVRSVSVVENGTPEQLDWTVSSDKSDWTFSSGLDVNSSYTVSAVAVAAQGGEAIASTSFHTITSASRLLTTPLDLSDGETVGVGMPIELLFNTDIPTADQPGIIAHIAVVSSPPQPGGWYWFAPNEVHYRPESFWLPGTTVTVEADLNGVDAGNGYWGLGDWSESFTIGPEHVTVVNTQTRTMQVYDGDPANGGQLLDTWPTNTGKPGFDTINGTLVVLYHTPVVDMNSCQTFHTPSACDPGGANYYLENVYEDTAVSSDGYFIHAAPWACWGDTCNGVYPYGQNTSHGCINLSTANATTYYSWSQVGDVVEVTGSPLEASFSDGEGDWQTPWSDLVPGGQEVPGAEAAAGGAAPTEAATPTPTTSVAGP